MRQTGLASLPLKSLAVAVLLSLAGTPALAADIPANVDGARIIAADKEPGNWMSTGRTYDEQRYSPLKQISDQNVGQLGLAWSYKLDLDRGVEATPIVVDGVMYTTGAFSIVYAFDAATGKPLALIAQMTLAKGSRTSPVRRVPSTASNTTPRSADCAPQG